MDANPYLTPPTSPPAYISHSSGSSTSTYTDAYSFTAADHASSSASERPSVARPKSGELSTTSKSLSLSTLTPSSSKRISPTPSPIQTFPPVPSQSSEPAAATTPLDDELTESLRIAQSSSPPLSPPTSFTVSKHQSSEEMIHPFANTTAKLEIIPSSTSSGLTNAHGGIINVEEEARLYAQLMGSVEDSADGPDSSSQGRIRTVSHPSKLHKSRPQDTPPPLNHTLTRSSTHPLPLGTSVSADDAVGGAGLSGETWPYTAYTPNPNRRRPPESVFSADIYLEDNTTPDGIASEGQNSRGSSTLPPLLAQEVRIDGWLVVGDGAGAKEDMNGASSSSTAPLSPISPGPTSPHQSPSISSSRPAGPERTLSKSKSTPLLSKSALLSPTLPRLSHSSGAYVVYDIVITTKEATTIRVLKRYSDFERLREGLVGRRWEVSNTPSLLSYIHIEQAWQPKSFFALPCNSALLTTMSIYLLSFSSMFASLIIWTHFPLFLQPPINHALIPPLPPKAPLARFRPAFLEKRRSLLEFWLTRVMLHPEVGGRGVVRGWVLE